MIQKLTVVNVGDKVTIKVGASVHMLKVLPPCESKSNGLWRCITHHKIFGNNFEKNEHIEKGAHKMAWGCWEHGVEKP